MNKNLLAILIVFTGLAVYGQSATQRLNQSEDDYEAGRLLGIPERLSGPLERKEFTGEEEIRARKLLALVYIFTDQETKAETALIQLLKKDPEHRLNPQTDPAELFFLYNQFRTAPIFRLGIRGGVNSSYPQVIRGYSTAQSIEYPYFINGKTPDGRTSFTQVGANGDPVSYGPSGGMGLGVFVELTGEYYLKKGFDIGLGAQYRISAYNIDAYINQELLLTSVTNSQSNLRVPLFVRYTLWNDNRDRNFLPYVMVGGSFDYLLQASYTDASRGGGTSFTLTSSDLIASDQVNRVNYSVFAGLGVKMRVKTHFLTFEAKFENSLANYINGSERYSNQASTFDLGFVEPDMSLNYLSLSIGYVRSIYKPKKLQ